MFILFGETKRRIERLEKELREAKAVNRQYEDTIDDLSGRVRDLEKRNEIHDDYTQKVFNNFINEKLGGIVSEKIDREKMMERRFSK